MDGESFERWFSQTLLRLEDNAVVVMDNAPYHSRRTEAIPTSANKKVDIKNWLQSKNIAFEEDMSKVQLLAILNYHRERYKKYKVDEMARSQGKTVLRLPTYHCELNPLELIWANIKNIVAATNTTFKFEDMKALFYKAVNQITAEKWIKCIKHVQKIEEKMWELDHIREINIEPIINTNDDSSSDISE